MTKQQRRMKNIKLQELRLKIIETKLNTYPDAIEPTKTTILGQLARDTQKYHQLKSELGL